MLLKLKQPLFFIQQSRERGRLARKFSWVLSLLLLLIPSMSFGLNSDSDLPAHFVADSVVYNYKQGITVFNGHVKMDQGTTHLTADEVTSYANNDGKIYQVIAIGNLAHYTTLPDNQDKIVDIFGRKITYYPLEKKAIVIGNGTVIQEPNQFNGEHLVYDMQKQLVTSLPVEGAQSVIVLQPQELPGKSKAQKPAPNKQTKQKPL